MAVPVAEPAQCGVYLLLVAGGILWLGRGTFFILNHFPPQFINHQANNNHTRPTKQPATAATGVANWATASRAPSAGPETKTVNTTNA